MLFRKFSQRVLSAALIFALFTLLLPSICLADETEYVVDLEDFDEYDMSLWITMTNGILKVGGNAIEAMPIRLKGTLMEGAQIHISSDTRTNDPINLIFDGINISALTKAVLIEDSNVRITLAGENVLSSSSYGGLDVFKGSTVSIEGDGSLACIGKPAVAVSDKSTLTITGNAHVTATGLDDSMDIAKGGLAGVSESTLKIDGGATLTLGKNGIENDDFESTSFNNCTIDGDGAEKQKIYGTYDANGKRILPIIAVANGENTVIPVNGERTLELANANAFDDYAVKSYQWYENDVEINGQTNANLSVSKAGNYKLEVTADSQRFFSNTITLTKASGNYNGGGADKSGPSLDGSTGWSGVIDKVKDAEDGETLTIDMDGTTKVDGGLFDAVAGRDITIILEMGGGISWTIYGGDVPVQDGGWKEIDLKVTQGTGYIPAEVQLRLAHEGEFGFKLTLAVKLDKANAGYFANLFYYNPETKALEPRHAVIIGADGAAAFPFERASDYLIVVSEENMMPQEPEEPEAWQNPFGDVTEGDWFYGDVEYAVVNGLFTGTSATAFSPGMPMTRGMLVTVLWRQEDSPEPVGGNPFDDLAKDWYRDAVAWAAENKIVAGYGNGLFGPEDPITREDMAVMLYRFCEYKGYDVSARADLSAYTDAGQISSWALDAMRWANALGLINGRTETTLVPEGTAGRAECAALLRRFLEE